MKELDRVIIFGRPGSGKSTFSHALAEQLDLPVYHLDRWFYTQSWGERDYQDFLTIQKEFIKQEKWIIDGNAMKSLEMRFAHAEVAIYFCYPFPVCLYRIFKRYFFKDKVIKDRPDNYIGEIIWWKLLTYSWNFDIRYAAQINELQIKYPQVKFYKITNNQDRDDIFNSLASNNLNLKI